MNFDLSDEQRMMRDTVRKFAEEEVKPRAAEIDRTDEFPWDLWKRMADLGFLAMTLPPEYGGSGMDTVAWAIAQEELGRASVVVADLQLLSKLMQDVLLRNGSESQKEKYLAAMGRGEKLCVFGQTEPGTGSDVAGITTTARRERDGYVLNGTKRFITGALVCDLAVVVATVDKSKGRQGISLFLVEKGTPGFSSGAKEKLMGVRGLETGELIFDNCWIPRECLLGPEGEGFKGAMRSLTTGRIGIGCEALGMAQAAMDESIRYAKQRVAFGSPIANLQAVQFKLAEMSAGIEAARLRLWHAAWLKDQGRPIIREASEGKLLASDLAMRVVLEAFQIHGAYGYSTDFPIERMYRDIKVYQIWEGTSEIQHLIIARQLLKAY